MARPASFDRDSVLEQITRLFWQEGYERTSMTMIEEATGLKRQSLYNTFGDKEAMYCAAIAAYRASVDNVIVGAMNADDFVSAVAGMLDAQLAVLSDPANPRGCLLTGGLQERGGDPGPAGDCIRAAQEASLEFLQDKASEGTFPPSIDPPALAAAAFALSRGMAVIARSGAGSALAAQAAEGFMQILQTVTDPGKQANIPTLHP